MPTKITKEELRRRRNSISKQECMLINRVLLLTISITFIFVFISFIIGTNSKINTIENSINQIEKDIEDLSIPVIYTYPVTNSQSVQSQIEESSIIDNIVTEKPLEEKYSSVFEWQVYTGDFGVEQLYFLKEQCDKYEIPMELMLSLICAESSFNSSAKASTSSASGYCQLVNRTAKWVYEDLLKYGEYDTNSHSSIMTSDWKLNIEMGCRLMYYLYWNNNESWSTAIQRYYGSKNPSENRAYLNKINNKMYELFNMTTNDFYMV